MENDSKHLDSLGDTEFYPAGRPAPNPVEENHHAIPGLCDCAYHKEARANIQRPYNEKCDTVVGPNRPSLHTELCECLDCQLADAKASESKLGASQSPPGDPIVGDPWANRAGRMHCGTCMWFVEKHWNLKSLTPSIGRCRRHAPTMGGYPVTYTNDWCGDHRLDENKSRG